MAKILCVDFDGVLHSYVSGWKGATAIPDPPVEGAMEWLLDCTEHFEVQVFSSRSKEEGGVEAMRAALLGWIVAEKLRTQRAAEIILENVIKFPTTKPGAFLSIDDRCIRFEGTWPSMKMMAEFRTWQGR